MEEVLDAVVKNIKNRKAANLNKIPPEVWKTRQVHNILLQLCNVIYEQNTIEKWTKGCILPFPKKNKKHLSITKNYSCITLSSITANVYNDLFLNYICSEVRNSVVRKIRMTFGEIYPKFHRFWLSVKLLMNYTQKIPR